MEILLNSLLLKRICQRDSIISSMRATGNGTLLQVVELTRVMLAKVLNAYSSLHFKLTQSFIELRLSKNTTRSGSHQSSNTNKDFSSLNINEKKARKKDIYYFGEFFPFNSFVRYLQIKPVLLLSLFLLFTQFQNIASSSFPKTKALMSPFRATCYLCGFVEKQAVS